MPPKSPPVQIKPEQQITSESPPEPPNINSKIAVMNPPIRNLLALSLGLFSGLKSTAMGPEVFSPMNPTTTGSGFLLVLSSTIQTPKSPWERHDRHPCHPVSAHDSKHLTLTLRDISRSNGIAYMLHEMSMLSYRLPPNNLQVRVARWLSHLHRNQGNRSAALTSQKFLHLLPLQSSSCTSGVMTTKGTFASTFNPSSQFTSLTVPERGATTSFCIFIASRIKMV